MILNPGKDKKMTEQRESILVVDDDSDVLQSLEIELSDYFDVTALLSAEQALATLQNKTFSAIVSDVMMPGIDGLSLIKQCAVRYPDMIRVLLTAFDDENVQQTAMGHFGAYKLIKPWGDNLIVTLQNALKQRKSRLELQQSLDMGTSAVDLDLRLSPKLKPDEVMEVIASEMLRIPEVKGLAIYVMDENGLPKEPLLFDIKDYADIPKLTRKRISNPKSDEKYYHYSVPVGNWPNPLAVAVLNLSDTRENSLRYLDFIGRQAYRTLLIVDPLAKKQLEKNQKIDSTKQTMTRQDIAKWISTEMSTPTTVITSAADNLREVAQSLVKNHNLTEISKEIEEITSDLDAAFEEFNTIVEKLKDI
jgi:CheY-like chemotaxis protein